MKTKLNFWRLSIPEKVLKSRNILEKMTNNVNFPEPNPGLQEITDVVDQLALAYEGAIDGGKAKKANMYRLEKTLMTIMNQLAVHIEDVSEGDETKVLSSGMEIRIPAEPSRAPEAPAEIKKVASTREGEVELKWASVKHARAYILEVNENPGDEKGWKFVDVCCKANYTVHNLSSLSVQWFRVSAVGLRGKSAYSDPIKAIVH